jgi:ParB/RepB/Spo0J family partition protein
MIELEFHQLDRRYEKLRTSSRQREAKLLASLDSHGQQVPVVVVATEADGRYVLVDGYKRVRALSKLRRDTVNAVCWPLAEQEALLMERLMGPRDASALEQGWLLRELRDRFALSVEELARRFDRSASWVSRRLGLVGELPEPIQQLVRRGQLVPHAAMKYLLPLARANPQGAIELASAIAPLRPSSRQTEALCIAYARGNAQSRRHLLDNAALFLRLRKNNESSLPRGTGEQLLHDLGALAGLARRARGHVNNGAVRELLPPEHERLRGRAQSARADTNDLFDCLIREIDDAGRAQEGGNSQAP